MAKFKFVCLVNAREGQDAAFNAWHTNVHIPEVVREAGFTSGKRMKVVKGLEGDARIYQYLVIYEGEIANPELALNKLGGASRSAEFRLPTRLGRQSGRLCVKIFPAANSVSDRSLNDKSYRWASLRRGSKGPRLCRPPGYRIRVAQLLR